MTDNDRVVCTHTIFAELCEVMPELAIAIVNDKNGHLFDLDLEVWPVYLHRLDENGANLGPEKARLIPDLLQQIDRGSKGGRVHNHRQVFQLDAVDSGREEE